MRFQVPQFIEVEDRIFGPLTFKQFIYLAGGVGFSVMLFTLSGLFLAILLGFPVLVSAIALAFWKINSRPFVEILQSATSYAVNTKLYLWKKKPQKKKAAIEAAVQSETEKIYVPKLTENKLRDIAWSLDIKESLYSETADAKALKHPTNPNHHQ